MPCQSPTCNFSIYDEDALDMAVFISPQYKDDDDILDAIYTYADAVYDDIGWNVGIVKVETSLNNYETIDELIESIYKRNPLKACLMIGEDMSINSCLIVTAYRRECIISLQGWSTYNKEYEISSECDIKVVAWDYIIDIPISLLYPSTSYSYTKKKDNIISALNKFATNRQKEYKNSVYAMFDAEIVPRDVLEGELPYIGDTTLMGNPTQDDIDNMLDKELKLLLFAGHALCNQVHANPGIFWKSALDSMNVPFFIPNGCFVNGWWSGTSSKCLYSPPANNDFFGHSIFDNSTLRVITCSIGQYENSKPAGGFIGAGCLRRMATGMTIAESMIGIITSASHCLMFGDPTFHY